MNLPYIVLAIRSKNDFGSGSFNTFWADKSVGVQEIIGTEVGSGKLSVQSYLFDATKWTVDAARKWLKEHFLSSKKTVPELLVCKKIRVQNSAILCASLPKLSIGTPNIDKLSAEAQLNDKYFFYVDGVHSGMNRNGHIFTDEELTKNYKSAGHQLIDWEHNRDQIVGFSLEAELKSYVDDSNVGKLAVAVNGIINRLSPFLHVEERVGDRVVLRDELIRDSYFKGHLAISMECMFDKMKCAICGEIFNDFLLFDLHTMLEHGDVLNRGEQVGKELIGVDFTGWGLLPVSAPADSNAYLDYLRTSDDGTISDIVVTEDDNKFGKLAQSRAFAREITEETPLDYFDTNKHVFASEKISTKINTKQDNKMTDNKSKGEQLMNFDLKEKIKGFSTLNDLVSRAAAALCDFLVDNELTESIKTDFVSQLNTTIAEYATSAEFKVENVTFMTKADVDKIVDAEKEKVTIASNLAVQDLQNQIDVVNQEKEALSAKVQEMEATIANLNKEQHDKEVTSLIDSTIASLKDDGVALTPFFEGEMRSVIKAKIELSTPDTITDTLDTYKKEVVAFVRQVMLTKASVNNGNLVPTTDEANTLTSEIMKIREANSK